jgi:RNA polymerase sigma factor (sigma-70 family)
LPEENKISRFEQIVLPHLDAAYNLARWLTHNDGDAQDVVQEAYLRAFKFFGGFHGGDSKAWLLTIVRNTSYTWLQRNRSPQLATTFDEEVHSHEGSNPETLLMETEDKETVKKAVAELPLEFREVIVLRELEGLSYKEISNILDVPVGTVMSRLARGRKRLQMSLTPHREGVV